MNYPYVFDYSSESIQHRKPRYLLQPCFGIMSTGHTHRTNFDRERFNSNFKSVFAETGLSTMQKFANMADILAPRSRLCKPSIRSPLLCSEASVKRLVVAIGLFTTVGRLVMEMYRVTLTAEMAAMIKGRYCWTKKNSCSRFMGSGM